jgi:hypothetical protein
MDQQPEELARQTGLAGDGWQEWLKQGQPLGKRTKRKK